MATSTLAVIDGNSLMHRAFHALPPSMTAPDGRPTNAVFGFVSMLVKMVADLEPEGVVVAFDRGKPSFRTEVLQQYKMHRPPTAEQLKEQFPMVKRLLEALAVPIVEAEGWEADDILGTLALRASEQGMQVLLVTGDRDALQLVTDSVHVVSTKKGVTDIVIYDPATVEERFGVRPDQIVDYLGLKGDASDNIPGIAGVGEKTAARLIAEYGSLDAVLDHADQLGGKLGENVRTHSEGARVSREVATIRRDVPVELDLSAIRWGAFDPSEAARAFGELRFTTLLDRVLATVSAAATPARTSRQAAAEPCEIVEFTVSRDKAARESLSEWENAGEWVGVALDDGTAESLFAMRRDLAVGRRDRVALVAGEDTKAVVGDLVGRARLAAGDVKSLLEAFGGLVGDGSSRDLLESVDPARLFDCGIAAYLLESGRSSYDLGSLSADYLSWPLPEPDERRPRVALEAHAAWRLEHELRSRLAADGSDEVFERVEMPLVPVLARMERVGVGLDRSVLQELSKEVSARLERLVSEIHDEAGVEFNIDSPRQLAEVLFDRLGLPTSKRTKTGYSTDASVLSGLAASHPIAQHVIDYRELAKLRSTYIEALPGMVGDDGRLHTSFNQTVAATGRLSSSNPNLQNIPVRTDLGRRIRAAFVPAESGDSIVSADYSQIELRILAHLSQDDGLIEAFTSGADFHSATAARVFGVDPDALPAGMRARAKAVNFGIVYGQTAHGLAASLDIPHAEAQAMIDRYYAAYPGVRRFLDETVAAAHRDGYAVTMFGRKRRIPELKSSNHNLRAFGERTAMNHPMQGTAADIMKLAMIDVDRRLREKAMRTRLVLQVHDELVFEAPADELDSLESLVRTSMAGVVGLAVPLDVSVSSGPDWASAK